VSHMALPGVHLGVRKGPFDTSLDANLAKRFAAATNDPGSKAAAGESVPPVVLMTQAWEAQVVGRDTINNQEVRHAASGGAHGQHDMRIHRSPAPGEPLQTWVEGWGSRPAGRNSLLTLYFSTLDQGGELVVEQWWTFIYVNVTCETVGKPLPDHGFPDGARERQIGTYDILLDAELPRRYAEVTNDWAEVHFDVERARDNGFPGLTAHGLSTLALCSQGVVAQFADGDPARVRRIAGRFSRPALLGEELHVKIYDGGPDVYAFEAECAGADVITNGRIELCA
jgi:hypothetical protein